MIPVQQTIFGQPQGNCIQAALASVLNRPLAEVPNVIDRDSWWEDINAWLRVEHSMELYSVPVEDGTVWAVPSGYHLMAGEGPRGLRHVVVGRAGVMVHDPHPSGDGLLNVDRLWLLLARLDE